jgi:hypothetical protein
LEFQMSGCDADMLALSLFLVLVGVLLIGACAKIAILEKRIRRIMKGDA